MFTTDISKIPNNPGVYLFKDRKGSILYVGKAKNLQKRLGQYFAINSVRKQEMLIKAKKIDFLIVKNESEALYLEDNLIKQHQPEYNNLLKADNSYVYIKITKEPFPQIFLTRKKINDGALYIGPKNNTIQLKKLLQYLRQILKFRGCKTTQFKQGKLCSDYYFGLCRGRCKLAKENYASDSEQITRPTRANIPISCQKEVTQEYQEIVKVITSFFKGNTKPIEREIHEQIETAVIHENYERAAQMRDIYHSIQGFIEKQDVVLEKKTNGYFSIIKTIGTQHIYTVLVFIKGKLMDVITSKQQTEDIHIDSLELAIQRDFGEAKTKNTKKEIQMISKNFAKIGKKVEKEIRKLAENFLESYIISQSLQEGTTLINDIFKTLKDRYKLKKIPYKIECIDISHLSGGRTSGGLSCFVGGLPYKKGYRKYKISGKIKVGSLKPSDDYAALEEVLERRFKEYLSSSSEIISGNHLPSCLIIDGGKGQLNVVKKLCRDPKRKKIVSQIDIISLGKGEARKKSNIGNFSRRDVDSSRLNKKISEKIYTLDDNLTIHETAIQYDQADKILLKARDEAHRFANSYRKKQMSKEFK